MLTLFPDLLTYSFFGPTVVRLALGGILVALAVRHFAARDRVENRFVAVGIAALEGVSGTLIVAGLFTQAAALASLIVSIKLRPVAAKYPAIFSPDAFALLCMAAISLLLIVTGPGAFAFDLPL